MSRPGCSAPDKQARQPRPEPGDSIGDTGAHAHAPRLREELTLPKQPSRSAWLENAIAETRAWISEQQAEIDLERAFMSPGDPDDDFEYDYNAAVARQIAQAERTLQALSGERGGLAG